MKLATALWAPLLLTLGACGSADTSGLYGGDPSGGGAAGTSESGGTHGSPRKGSGGGAPGGSGGAGAEPSSGGSGGAQPSSGGSGGGGAAPASGGAGPASGGAGGTPEVSCKDDKKCKPLICLKKLHICGPPGPTGMPCDRDEECISDSCEDDQCE